MADNALYKTARWQRLRRDQLRRHPLCQCPICGEGKHKITPATVVDHKTPHRGDKRLFFDPANLQSMSKEHHDRFKQSQERGGQGFNRGCDANGWPNDPDHGWNGARDT